jgi:hypothetical protein
MLRSTEEATNRLIAERLASYKQTTSLSREPTFKSTHQSGTPGDIGNSGRYCGGGGCDGHAKGSSYSAIDLQLEQLQCLEDELKML